MGDILLNALPLNIKADDDTVACVRWRRDDDIDTSIRELPGRNESFCHFSFVEYSYGWAVDGGSLPGQAPDVAEDVRLGEVPAAVVAFAARRAAVATLCAKGSSSAPRASGSPRG